MLGYNHSSSQTQPSQDKVQNVANNGSAENIRMGGKYVSFQVFIFYTNVTEAKEPTLKQTNFFPCYFFGLLQHSVH